MTKAELVEKALKKYKKARRIPVENFSMGYDKWSMEMEMNLEMDRGLYKWDASIVNAIRYIIDNKCKCSDFNA